MTITEYKQRLLELEKQIADLRTSRNLTAPTRCPECKHEYNASVGGFYLDGILYGEELKHG